MIGEYLDELDALVAAGVASLSPAFRDMQRNFLLVRQCADGGFRGRKGGSDLYYTDFAVRGLRACGVDLPVLAHVAEYISPLTPVLLVDCFNLLNISRGLARAGVEGGCDMDMLRQFLRAAPLPRGSYDRFLFSLSTGMLGESIPLPPNNDDFEQTNLAAAEIGAMIIQGDFNVEKLARGAEFLRSMQVEDGGFRAHPAAPGGDLLPTFTALLTLRQLDGGLCGVNLKRMGQFVKSVACPDGGFHGCLADPGSDTEYAYYGLGTLAILRAAVDGL